ncbi:hypothetical protein ACFYMB_10395 [Micromonospora haikouensis]|uniref:hypothetical protein n=1 Tax=Micromonospora haikouensis TaxID=686309 RepID=UPI0036AD6B82
MGERGVSSRYAYWSDRAVCRVAQDEGIDIAPGWKTKITVFKVPILSTGVDFEREARTLYRHEVADRIERAVGDLAVEDFVTPPPVGYAKGLGRVEFSRFVCPDPNSAVLNVQTSASDGSRVVVCLFGSRDNIAGFMGVHDREVSGWSSSAMWAVHEWLATRCAVNNSQWDDAESISVEAMKIATDQGTNESFRANPDQPWTRGFAFGDAPNSEWFAEIYSDVILDKDRWSLDEPVDRILVGAPLWVRTPRSAVRRYRDYRRRFNHQDSSPPSSSTSTERGESTIGGGFGSGRRP